MLGCGPTLNLLHKQQSLEEASERISWFLSSPSSSLRGWQNWAFLLLPVLTQSKCYSSFALHHLLLGSPWLKLLLEKSHSHKCHIGECNMLSALKCPSYQQNLAPPSSNSMQRSDFPGQSSLPTSPNPVSFLYFFSCSYSWVSMEWSLVIFGVF